MEPTGVERHRREAREGERAARANQPPLPRVDHRSGSESVQFLFVAHFLNERVLLFQFCFEIRCEEISHSHMFVFLSLRNPLISFQCSFVFTRITLELPLVPPVL